MSELIKKNLPYLEGMKPSILNCPVHGKYNGWILTLPDGKVFESKCDACHQADHQLAAERLVKEIAERQKAALAKAKWEAADIPKLFQGNTIRSFKAETSSAVAVLHEMAKFIKDFDGILKTGRSYIFSGDTGRGKTHLSTAVANNLIERGYSAKYATCLDYFSQVKRSWIQKSMISEDEIIQSFTTPDLLILDEMGRGTETAKEKDLIFRVIDNRTSNCKPTIGITNQSPLKLKSILGEEVLRRFLMSGGQALLFDWQPFC